jgi:lipoprotein-anchoring transpeptidase ErfK/SrfK
MRRFAAALALALLGAIPFFALPAKADLLIHVDKSRQRMTVTTDGFRQYVWPVSTGRRGYGTPVGTFRPQWLARSWFSRRYYNSPMPYSIFFYRGYAIHGSYAISRLGGPASHGCVRLHPRNAATLFGLVQRYGRSHTRIVISNSPPGGGAWAGRRHHGIFGGTDD